MSYEIHYSPGYRKRYPMASKKRKRTLWVPWLLMVVLFAGALWLRTSGVPDVLIPGDPAVTRSAVRTMVVCLREGVPLEDAFTAFCRQVLDGAV